MTDWQHQVNPTVVPKKKKNYLTKLTSFGLTSLRSSWLHWATTMRASSNSLYLQSEEEQLRRYVVLGQKSLRYGGGWPTTIRTCGQCARLWTERIFSSEGVSERRLYLEDATDLNHYAAYKMSGSWVLCSSTWMHSESTLANAPKDSTVGLRTSPASSCQWHHFRPDEPIAKPESQLPIRCLALVIHAHNLKIHMHGR